MNLDSDSKLSKHFMPHQVKWIQAEKAILHEFAKHPNAKLLWETAQGRIALGHDLAIWSAHDGEDTLFNEFAQEARAARGAHDSARASSSASPRIRQTVPLSHRMGEGSRVRAP